jgi:hypothetical protein
MILKKAIFILILMLQSINLLAVDYLVVIPMEFLGNQKLNQLISHRQETMTVMGVVYENYSDIKATIVEQYRLGLKYVLLVGDNGSIPCVNESDNYYGCMDSDNVPDIAVGRFPCSTNAELDNMVTKTLNFENIHGAWGNKMIYIGGESNNPYLEMSLAKNRYLSQYTIEYVNSRSRLIEKFNEGIYMAIYGGNGSLTSWQYLNINDAVYLSNEIKPVVLSVSSYSGSLTNYSLMQALVKSSFGAVATIGCAVDSDWSMMVDPFCYAMSLKPQRLGDLFLAWKHKLSSQSSSERNYCLLGDPALKIPIPIQRRAIREHKPFAIIKSGE